MVQKIISGMRRIPAQWLVLIAVLAIGAVTLVLMRPAQAAPFANQLWINNSPAQECIGCSGCGCGGPVYTEENVNPVTGQHHVDIALFSKRTRLGVTPFSVRWMSMISGQSQFGNAVIPSWEVTAEKMIVNSGSPNSPHGHYFRVDLPSGRGARKTRSIRPD